MKYSIVIPCYKSSQTIGEVVDKTIDEFSKMNLDTYELEFVLVNDFSEITGETYKSLIQLAQKYSFVKIIDLAKNVGQHNATMAGLRNCTGDYVISMDDDMQTNPNQIYKLINALDENTDIVYAYYPQKKENLFRLLGSYFNEKASQILLKKPKNVKSSSFWIMKKFLKDEIIKYDGKYTYLLGLILQSTAHIKCIEVKHYSREHGSSGYNLRKLVSLFSNIIGFSTTPLRFAMHLGNVISFLSFILGILLIIRKLVDPTVTVGWISIIVSIFFSLGLILMFLGLIGEYLGRTYLQLNKQPQYVIRKSQNIINEQEDLNEEK